MVAGVLLQRHPTGSPVSAWGNRWAEQGLNTGAVSGSAPAQASTSGRSRAGRAGRRPSRPFASRSSIVPPAHRCRADCRQRLGRKLAGRGPPGAVANRTRTRRRCSVCRHVPVVPSSPPHLLAVSLHVLAVAGLDRPPPPPASCGTPLSEPSWPARATVLSRSGHGVADLRPGGGRRRAGDQWPSDCTWAVLRGIGRGRMGAVCAAALSEAHSVVQPLGGWQIR